jgi:hypothetical protein
MTIFKQFEAFNTIEIEKQNYNDQMDLFSIFHD